MGNSHQPFHSKKITHYKKRGGEGEKMIQNVTMDESSTDDMEEPMRPVPMRPAMPMRPVPMRPAMPMRPATPIRSASAACPPCPPCAATEGEPKESFFSKLSPQKLNDKLVETQNNFIEGSKTKLNDSVSNAKAGLANKINGFLGQPTVAAAPEAAPAAPAAGGGRRTKRKTKKRSKKSKRSKRSKRSKLTKRR